MKILDLVAEILDDFRLRLSQMIHHDNENWPFSQKFFSILNTFDFMLALINDLNLNNVWIIQKKKSKIINFYFYFAVFYATFMFR